MNYKLIVLIIAVLLLLPFSLVVRAVAERIPIEINRPIYATEWWDTTRIQFRGWAQVAGGLDIIERIPDKHGLLDSLVVRAKQFSLWDSTEAAHREDRRWMKVKVITPPILGYRLDTVWIEWHPPMIYPKEKDND